MGTAGRLYDRLKRARIWVYRSAGRAVKRARHATRRREAPAPRPPDAAAATAELPARARYPGHRSLRLRLRISIQAAI